jgi:hypothetical protein
MQLFISRRQEPGVGPAPNALDRHHVCGLKSLGSLHNLKFDCRTFLEVAITISLNRGIMYEDVLTLAALDEAVPLGGIEPLNGPSFSIVAHFTSTPSDLILSVLLALAETKKGRERCPGASLRTQKVLQEHKRAHTIARLDYTVHEISALFAEICPFRVLFLDAPRPVAPLDPRSAAGRATVVGRNSGSGSV